MENTEVKKQNEQGQNRTSSLERERRGIRIMKLLLGMFSIILILAMLLTLILNR